MSEENQNSEQRMVQEDEIDLIELAKTIWAGRKFIAKVTGGFMLFGLLIAFTSPVEYEASSKLLPESQEGSMPNLGGLGGLAGLAGINLGGMSGGGGVLSPMLYPEIVNSLPFILEVMNDTVYFETLDLHTTSFHYFKNIAKPSLMGYVAKYTIGLPGLIKGAIVGKKEERPAKESEFYRISKSDWSLIENFKKRISVNNDDKTGIISITVEMPDPLVAAQLAKKIEIMITMAVTKYKTDKSLDNLEFVTETYQEAKTKFEKVQYTLARTVDRNKNVSSAIARINQKRIENEYNLAFEVYKGLASQVEQAKIKLKEETPVFTVLEPVRVPEDKSKPKRGILIVVFCFVGITFSTGILILKEIFSSFTK